jgi:hypothetical protein
MPSNILSGDKSRKISSENLCASPKLRLGKLGRVLPINLVWPQLLIRLCSNLKGYSASVMAKRKASISALEDISNAAGRLNFSNCDSPSRSAADSPDLLRRQTKQSQPAHQTQMTPLVCKWKPTGAAASASASSVSQGSCNGGAKEYVESLHQNNKSQLIYGKNNVVVKQASA